MKHSIADAKVLQTDPTPIHGHDVAGYIERHVRTLSHGYDILLSDTQQFVVPRRD
ncbi:hypothetical protein Voc01_104710 [Virgisporangium ochraceum]|uniref:Uncharacterized protein n=1 Tax=Virgisporangium ochraceum TaxID=65505 RepID=A0A8J4A470_9ACTN|nr:hypothetical protein Voc01_104710 [Virgisporangium ochraceum]